MDTESVASTEVIVPLVLELFPVRSVIDFGCGHGAWLRVFQRHGVASILGVDGRWIDENQLLIPRDCFVRHDLREPFFVGRRFELAVALEVAEHLPAPSAAAFVRSITLASPAVLFSAAIPGQCGTGHVNEQWPDYWANLFRNFGYVRLDPFRRRLWMDPRVAWYYQQNLFLYVEEGMLRQHARLAHEKSLADQCALTLVHPKSLRPMRSLRAAIALLPRLVWAALKRRLLRWDGRGRRTWQPDPGK